MATTRDRSREIHIGAVHIDAFVQLLMHDEKMLGTPGYLGMAYFWNHEYKHTLREVSYATRRRIHHALLAAGLKLEGKSRKHEKIIDANLRAADHRRLRECYG
jgi:hypothetical protein